MKSTTLFALFVIISISRDISASEKYYLASIDPLLLVGACQTCFDSASLTGRCLMDCPRCDDGIADGCWLEDHVCSFEPEATDVVVATINIHGGGSAEAVGRYITHDWPFGNTFYAIQESGGQSSRLAGSCCQARESMLDDVCLSNNFDTKNLGIIILGEEWVVDSSQSWKIGSDRIGICSPVLNDCGRYLLEVVLRHIALPYRFRYYSTHLSHNSENGSQGGQRADQVEKLISIVSNRVQQGELPPIIAGDFNMNWTDDSYNLDDVTLARMSSYFILVNREFDVCPNVPDSKIDHIWLGNPCSFPGTMGQFIPQRHNKVSLNGASDHDAFVANFKIRSNRPMCPVTPPPTPCNGMGCCEWDSAETSCLVCRTVSGCP